MAGPCHNKYKPIAQDIGNKKEYKKVSISPLNFQEPHDEACENWMNF